MNRPRLSAKVGRARSEILDGAKAVAGVADAAASTGWFATDADGVRSVSGAVAVVLATFCSSVAAEARADVTGEAAATGVSTVGERDGTATAGMSDGPAGVPAAIDSFELLVGGTEMPAADSLGASANPSDPTAEVGAGEAKARVSVFLPCLLATADSGIGLGSMAGLASVEADATTAAASDAGLGEPPVAGLCNQPRS